MWIERKLPYPELRKSIHRGGAGWTDVHDAFNQMADEHGFDRATVVEYLTKVFVESGISRACAAIIASGLLTIKVGLIIAFLLLMAKGISMLIFAKKSVELAYTYALPMAIEPSFVDAQPNVIENGKCIICPTNVVPAEVPNVNPDSGLRNVHMPGKREMIQDYIEQSAKHNSTFDKSGGHHTEEEMRSIAANIILEGLAGGYIDFGSRSSRLSNSPTCAISNQFSQ